MSLEYVKFLSAIWVYVIVYVLTDYYYFYILLIPVLFIDIFAFFSDEINDALFGVHNNCEEPCWFISLTVQLQ